MCLNLLLACEDFLNEIANQEENEELSAAIENLKELLENEEDGRTLTEWPDLIDTTKSRLEDIFDLISEEEKCANHLLTSHYHELMDYLNDSEPPDGEYEMAADKWEDHHFDEAGSLEEEPDDY